MVMSLHKKIIREILIFFVPILIILIGTIIAIYTKDFIYLRNCTIAGYFFIPLFIWRLSASIYYNVKLQSSKEKEENNF